MDKQMTKYQNTLKQSKTLNPYNLKLKPKRIRKKTEPKQEPKQKPIITPPPPPPIPEKQRIQGKMIKCNICGKELLEKTFKY